MRLFFPTLAAVLLGLSFEEYYASTALPEEDVLLLLLVLPIVLLPWAAGEALLRLQIRALRRGRVLDLARLARYVRHAPLVLYALALFGLGWPRVLVPLGLEGTVLVDHLVVLSPYFVALAGAEIAAQRLRRPLRWTPSGPTPAAVRQVLPSVYEQARHLGLLVVPLFTFVLFLDLALDTPLRIYFEHLPLLSAGGLVLLLLLLATVYPTIFRLGMGLRPLVAGAPLRRRLEELAAHLGFRCRDILYWPTRRPVLNAAIVGLLPRWRYVILTEELCRRLTIDELCAVFAHEVGHGKRHHAATYLVFSVAYLTLLVPIGDSIGRAVAAWTHWSVDADLAAAALVFLPGFALYWFVLFAALSRRFELEADVFAVEATGDAALFIVTLEKVAALGRIDRRVRAPRHFSIQGRTDFLRQVFLEGRRHLLDEFRSTLRRLRRAVHGAGAIVLLAAALSLGIDSIGGAGAILLERGLDLRARKLLSLYARIESDDLVAQALLAEIDLSFNTPAPPGGGPHWRAVVKRAERLTPPERAALLETLAAGWGRAVSKGRFPEALVLVERARRLNRIGTREEGSDEVFDAEFEIVLTGMERVTRALIERDVERLEPFARKPPRWLRRPDLRPVLERIRRTVREAALREASR